MDSQSTHIKYLRLQVIIIQLFDIIVKLLNLIGLSMMFLHGKKNSCACAPNYTHLYVCELDA